MWWGMCCDFDPVAVVGGGGYVLGIGFAKDVIFVAKEASVDRWNSQLILCIYTKCSSMPHGEIIAQPSHVGSLT